MKLLDGIRVLNLAINLPGPAAARRLQQLGAQVVKIEPPSGDPMKNCNPKWYYEMNGGQEILTMDLKSPGDREILNRNLEKTDLLITATRPAALERLGLGWDDLHREFPRLCQVAIVGYPSPFENEPGHDLTYQAKVGLLTPPQMPRTLVADLAGAEKAASEGLALLLARERGQDSGYAQVALSDAAEYMAEPWKTGLTAQGALLGGGVPEYNLYEANGGWVAVAALEPHFKKRMDEAFGCAATNPDELRPLFKTKTPQEWQQWATDVDLPIVAVKID